MRSDDVGEESWTFFTSAFEPNPFQRPIIRRRLSSSTSAGNGGYSTNQSRHRRMGTESGVMQTSGGHQHPLTSGQGSTPGSIDITRPHLTRAVNKTDEDLLCDVHDVHTAEARGVQREQEQEVIVHEVKHSDSLAGVSLKYGITLADLRIANHLWASDSIHLRKMLYIPVDKSSRARDLLQEMQSKTVPIIDAMTPLPEDDGITPSHSKAPSSPDRANPPNLEIQRIPASRLSFFPPPSTSGKTPSISSSPSPSPSRPKDKVHGRYASTPFPSLATILTALPITASTRDDLLARLSFDSVSSSTSDRFRQNPEADSHELGVVTNHQPPDFTNGNRNIVDSSDDFDEILDLFTPRADYEPKIASYSIIPRQTSSGSEVSYHHRPSTSSRTAYISQSKLDHSTIRTVQLEPSPMMQLPNLPSRKPNQRNYSDAGPSHSRTNAFELL